MHIFYVIHGVFYWRTVINVRMVICTMHSVMLVEKIFFKFEV